MFKRMAIMLLATGAVLGGLYGFQTFKAGMIQKVMAGMANPPQTVSTTTASLTDWQSEIEAVGTLKAVNGADLALQVAGIVEERSFDSGDTVAAGQTLLKLSAEDDIAKLAALQATADNYAISLKRAQEQQKFSAVSQATVDSDAASYKNAVSLVDQQKAVVDQKTLRAPFAGRLGIRAVDLGQYLTAGTTIVTLQSLDTLYVDLYLPQQTLSQLEIGQEVTTTVDAFPAKIFPGKISAINSKVDATSRNVQIRAAMSNPGGLLLPGMFGRVKIVVGTSQKFVTLPQTAMVYNPYGDSVFIVDHKDQYDPHNGVARETFIKSGETRGDNVAILEGVKEDEQVVNAGQIKLRNGTPVIVDNSHVPTSQNAPDIKDK